MGRDIVFKIFISAELLLCLLPERFEINFAFFEDCLIKLFK